MAYIYKLTNKINGKVYIGQTSLTIEHRLQQHIRDSKRQTMENRPLYRAFRKYGYDNFIVEEIEQCEDNEVNKREQYWINYYNSYYNGYNATLGGEGSIIIDRQLVVDMYKKLKTCKAVAKELKIGADTVSDILKSQGIEIISGQEWSKINKSKPVDMLDDNNNIIMTFNTLKKAALYIQKEKNITTEYRGITSHIRDVCNRKRKTAYSHKWQWNKGKEKQNGYLSNF